MVVKETMWYSSWYSKNVNLFIKVKPIFSKKSQCQLIDVMESEIFGRILALDGQIQYSRKFDAYIHESTVHFAMLTHPNPKKVLVIGGGEGGSAREIAKYPVDEITVCEIDPLVTETCKKYFPELAIGFEDERVSLIFQNGRKYLEKTKKKYDVIIMDITDPIGIADPCFTLEFYNLINKRLNKEGTFQSHIESPDYIKDLFFRLVHTMKLVFPILRPYRVWIPCFTDFFGMVVGSKGIDPLELNIEDIREKINKLNLELRWLTPKLFFSALQYFSKDILDELHKHWEIINDESKIEFERP